MMTDPIQARYVSIRASAGTGKTFQLTNRYLALLASGELPERILATTFTRKAAGEIGERVLQRLARAATDDAARAELGRGVGRPNLSANQAAEWLGRLVRRVHRTNICTLDSLFIRMAGSFVLELGLPPGAAIAEERTLRRMRRQAVSDMLDDQEPQRLVDLIRLMSKGEVTRGVAEQIDTVVVPLHELYLQTDPGAWRGIDVPEAPDEAAVGAAIEALEALTDPRTRSGTPVKAWAKARAEAIGAVHRGDWLALIGKGVVAKVLAGQTAFSGHRINDEVRRACETLIAQARHVLLKRVADQTAATAELIERYHQKLWRRQVECGALSFADVTRVLGGGSVLGKLDELYYRMDGRLAHLLLDEFQDTSLIQWAVLEPFARELHDRADEAHTVMAVGDLKQAIYGWRGGEAGIFDLFEQRMAGAERRTIELSYRSAQPIIDAVNGVFCSLADTSAARKYGNAIGRWSANYRPHKTAKAELPGRVCLHTASRADDDAGDHQWTVTLGCAADHIAALTREHPARTIGALVRTNDAVRRLIFELQQRGVTASEEGGNPLTDSPVVSLVLSLLMLADHPGDTIARFHVVTSPLAPIVGLADERDHDAARALSRRVRRSLIERGYGPTCFDWARQLADVCDQRNLHRMLQLVELAERYDDESTLRPIDFVQHVRRERVESPVAARVRVMTVWQAKGLEFDVVVAPELDKSLVGQTPAVMVDRPRPIGQPRVVARYANAEIQALSPQLADMAEQWRDRRVNESLNVLYVMLTRAIHALHLVIAPPGENRQSTPLTFAGIVQETLAADDELEPDQTWELYGWPDWDGVPAGAVSGAEPAIAGPPRLAPVDSRRRRRLPARSPSQLEGGQRVDLQRVLRPGQAGATRRGSVFHAWFELIGWLDDGEPDDAALREAAKPFGVQAEEVETWIGEFGAMLGAPAIRQALQRSAYPPAAEVQRERRFAVRDGDGLLNGAIDRLVVVREGDRITAAEVIDFKTDLAEDDAAIEALVEHYRPQIDAYRRAAAKLTHLPIESISAKLLFVGAGAARTV